MRAAFAAAGALALVLTLAAAPAAQAAVHGVDWAATGTALQGGKAYLFQLAWDGCLGCVYGTYTVKLTDPATLAATQATFPGRIDQQNAMSGPFFALWEVLTLTGEDTSPTVTFAFTTTQAATVNGAPHLLSQVVTGTYQGMSFTAVTAAQPWDGF